MSVAYELKLKRAELTNRLEELAKLQVAVREQVSSIDRVIATYESGHEPTAARSRRPGRTAGISDEVKASMGGANQRQVVLGISVAQQARFRHPNAPRSSRGQSDRAMKQRSSTRCRASCRLFNPAHESRARVARRQDCKQAVPLGDRRLALRIAWPSLLEGSTLADGYPRLWQIANRLSAAPNSIAKHVRHGWSIASQRRCRWTSL
jgi:hypothetical protein